MLAELAAAFEQRTRHAAGRRIGGGGVDAAKRVQAGERFDTVMLASDAIDKLIAAGHLLAGSRVDIVRSPVAGGPCARVRRGPTSAAKRPCSRPCWRRPASAFPTGPSGTFLMQLFERWGISADVQGRIVQAKPGVPVAKLHRRRRGGRSASSNWPNC